MAHRTKKYQHNLLNTLFSATSISLILICNPALSDDYAASSNAQISEIIQPVYLTPGTPRPNYASAISSDGSILLGQSVYKTVSIYDPVADTTNDYDYSHAFIWDNGTPLSLGDLSANNEFESRGHGMVVKDNVTYVVGEASYGDGSQKHAFLWRNGTMYDLGDFTANQDGTSVASAISRDSSTVVGYAQYNSAGSHYAFRYRNGIMENLGAFGDFTNGYSIANAVSQDGSVVVGSANDRAFRWENGSMVYLTPNIIMHISDAVDVSNDGSTVTGNMIYGNMWSMRWHAFIWKDDITIEIGDFSPGNNRESFAKAISGNGEAVIGKASNGSGVMRAFYWKDNELTDIGTLRQDNSGSSEASSVSDNGLVVVGSAFSDTGFAQDFVWTKEHGIKSVEQVITDASIDVSTWDFRNSNNLPSISEDGNTIVGHYRDSNGNLRPYIFLRSDNPYITSQEELMRSITTNTIPVQQAHGALASHHTQSLHIARNALQYYLAPSYHDTPLHDIAPAAGNAQGASSVGQAKAAAYVTGNFGIGTMNDLNNHNAMGSTGFLFQTSSDTALGLGIMHGYNREETYLDGNSRTYTTGVSMMGSYEPSSSGLRVYGIATAAKLDTKINRHYLNGNTMQSTRGDTEGMGYGLAVRTGYVLDNRAVTQIMPYIEADFSHINLDGYQEHGGVFTGNINSNIGRTNSNYVASRLGAEISHPLNDKTLIRGHAAWGHRYSDESNMASSVAGMNFNMPIETGNRHWADIGVNVNYRVTDKVSLIGDLSGNIGRVAEPAVHATAGMIWGF